MSLGPESREQQPDTLIEVPLEAVQHAIGMIVIERQIAADKRAELSTLDIFDSGHKQHIFDAVRNSESRASFGVALLAALLPGDYNDWEQQIQLNTPTSDRNT